MRLEYYRRVHGSSLNWTRRLFWHRRLRKRTPLRPFGYLSLDRHLLRVPGLRAGRRNHRDCDTSARGTFFVLVTIAFCEVLRFTAIGWRDLTEGSMGVTIIFKKSLANMMLSGKRGYVILAFAYMVLVYAVCKIIERRKFGYSLVAIREDQDAAQACGVPASNVKTLATVLSAALTSVGGSIYAFYLLYIEPDVVFDIMISVQIILIDLFGSKGKAFGPIVGAMLIIPLTSFLRGQLSGISGLHGFVYGLALALIMIFLPEGIYGRLWRWALSKKTRPNRGVVP